ncbi:FecR family protein [Flavitalea sp. BT771]|uniref:FecR family protein n=1 Tax=Flavitalea sp. BT771 TaxID=3063329 RepID=UPI0026E34A69|nr:FecR family protein [Flavitalea sp. BT771]MDO6432801.1 FecR family protein [Flavitalea sp. BT771]MDV6221923.1 FecR family protein [Flavitalea sp. BT771]
MSASRLWELLARKHNNELSGDEQEELDQLLRLHQDVFELNETFSRLKDMDVKKLTTPADEEKSRQSIAARIAALAPLRPEEVRPDEIRTDDILPDHTHTNEVRPNQIRPDGIHPNDIRFDASGEVAPQSAQPDQQDFSAAEDFPPPSRVLKRVMAWAAVCCCLVVGAVWVYQLKNPLHLIENKQNEVATSLSKSKVQLPDGSIVMLNRHSKLVYNKDFGATKREISLTGEAFFDISKNESVPLTVIAGAVRIRVMGTAFNVRAYSDDSTIETSLIRGSIEVSSIDDPERPIRMRPNEKIVFGKEPSPLPSSGDGKALATRKPAQTFVQMNRIKPNPIDSTINEIVWVQDKLVFSKEPFYSVAQKMERWFQVRIKFKDRISEQLSLTGSLEKESLTEALDALQQLTPFNYKIDGGVVTISKKINPIN